MCMTQRKNQCNNKYMNYYRTCLPFVRSMLGAKSPWLISTTYVMCDEDIERTYSEHSLSRLWENTRWLMSGWPRTKKQIRGCCPLASPDVLSVLLCSSLSRELTFVYCESSFPVLRHSGRMNNGEPEKEKNENLGYFTFLVLPLPASLNIIFLVGCVSYNRSQGSICHVCLISDTFFHLPSHWDKENNKEIATKYLFT